MHLYFYSGSLLYSLLEQIFLLLKEEVVRDSDGSVDKEKSGLFR